MMKVGSCSRTILGSGFVQCALSGVGQTIRLSPSSIKVTSPYLVRLYQENSVPCSITNAKRVLTETGCLTPMELALCYILSK
ncbi:Protein argonaute 1 [Zea mays]|uniref:Protein argonaute 1 n=1 Tax=Zea mays TaxID=4577 RepID=A0A1D6H6U1_MAIZE|nr:Protein argonaute 1 [Zea mays]